MNAMTAAFEKAGYSKIDFGFARQIQIYLQSGGRVDRAHALIGEVAKRMREMDRCSFENRIATVQVPQPIPSETNPHLPSGLKCDVEGGKLVEDGEATRKLSKDLGIGASLSSSDRDRAGHPQADNRAIPARSVREPTAQQRRIAGENAKVMAITILDSIKTSDGRAWGDVGAHELDGMHRDGAMAWALKREIGVLPEEMRFKKLRELIKPAKFEQIYQMRKISDVAI